MADGFLRICTFVDLDDRQDDLRNVMMVIKQDGLLVESPLPRFVDLLNSTVLDVAAFFHNDVKDIVPLLNLSEKLLSRDIRLEIEIDGFLHHVAAGRIGRHFVTDGEQVALLFSLVEAIDLGLQGSESPRQILRLCIVATTAAFEPQIGELVGDADVGFALRDLQRRLIESDVTESHHHNMRVRDRLLLNDAFDEGS